MKRIRTSVILGIVVLGLSASTAEAGWLSRLHRQLKTQRPNVSYHQRFHDLNRRYPKYTGGFHYSYFRDIGVPPGDVGFRTNGLYLTPW